MSSKMKVKKTRFSSVSEPGVYHWVAQNGQGVIIGCTCKGWAYHRKCRHVEQVIQHNLKKHGVDS